MLFTGTMGSTALLGTPTVLTCAVAFTLSLASFHRPSTADACGQLPPALVMLDDGETIPADGVIAFEKGAWDLTRLLADDAAPPDSAGGYFHRRDVVRVQTEDAVDVPGTLATVADYIVFRPSQELAAGRYTVVFREYPRQDFERSIEIVVDSATDTELPSLQATSKHVRAEGNLAACDLDIIDSCGRITYVARDDVDMAQYSLNQTFSSDLLRLQWVTVATANGATTSCLGCPRLDVLRTAEELSSLSMDVKVIDLRSGQVIYEEQQDVTYDGPLGSTPRNLTAQDFLNSPCRTAPEGLEDEWCEKLRPACADDTTLDPRCEDLSIHCGEDPLEDGRHYCGGYEGDDSAGNSVGSHDGEAATARARGCSMSPLHPTPGWPLGVTLTLLFVLARSHTRGLNLKKSRARA